MEAVIQHSWFFYGWVIVATAALGLLLGAFPISVASFGRFFPAYVADFHERRSAISPAFTLHNLAAALCTVIVGRLADRLGAKRVILADTSALGVILVSALSIGSHVELYVRYGLLVAAGAATTVSRYVELRSLGVVGGVTFGAYILAGGIGPLVMDVAFDHFASYAPSFAVALILTLLGTAFLTRLGPYRFGTNGDL